MIQTSFTDLECKYVINMVDGKNMGHIIDIVFEPNCGKILGIVVPYRCEGFFLLGKKSRQQIFIPYNNICKIGEDTVLVEMYLNEQQNPNGNFYRIN